MLISLVSQLAQLLAGTAFIWGAWRLRKVAAYSWLMLFLGAAHLFTGVIGLFHFSAVDEVAVWRQPAFVLQRGLLASLAIVIVNRNQRLQQIAKR